MKTRNAFFGLLTLVLTVGASGFAEEVGSLVQDEYRKVQSDYQEAYTRLRRRVNDLASYRGRVIQEARKRAEFELSGVELIKKYVVVIASRYRNESTGIFEPGLEITAKDQENVGKVLGKYLGQMPLQGRVSAGEAKRQLDWAIRRLAELAKVHLEPTEENNSELEILAYQVRDADVKLRKVIELAKNLGVELNDSGVENRQTASEKN